MVLYSFVVTSMVFMRDGLMNRDEIKARVGPGWHALIDETLDKMEAVYPEVEIVDVKSIRGTLRLMLGLLPIKVSSKLYDLAIEALHKSETIPEESESG